LVEITLAQEHVNDKGTMHGGFTAAMTDIVTARAVGVTVSDVPMVSVEIAVRFNLMCRNFWKSSK
jgi:acyl-coenzyme A thioesterase PaaI-like protein